MRLTPQERSLDNLDLLPRISHQLEELFSWLSYEGLTFESGSYDVSSDEFAAQFAYDPSQMAMAQSTHPKRTVRLTQEELKKLKNDNRGKGLGNITQEAIWTSQQDPDYFFDRQLCWERIPADAMAFYRPFHIPPFDQWGVYLLVEPLLAYHQTLFRMTQKTALYSPEVLMHLIVFEVFNHEFFHHLVESTATTIEVLEAAQGRKRSVYLDYKNKQFKQDGFDHPHQPLEEALANAYAYNSLSFISRIKAGFKTSQVKTYQRAIQRHWQFEPAGYRDAHFYTGGNYVAGGAHLLSQLLGQPFIENDVPLANVVKHVMPTGFSALTAKPDIPVWLVGSPGALKTFEELVPAPLEAYTQLFWPYDTSGFDSFVEKKLKEKKAEREARKAAAAQGSLL